MSLSARLILDLVMLGLFLASFAWRFTGNTVHEIGGFLLLAAAILHNGLNRRWYRAIPQGRHRPVRRVLTAVDLGLLIATAAVMTSGLTNSRLLGRLTGAEWEILSRQFHSAAAHWVLLFAALHLGLHLRLFAGAFRKHAGIDLDRGGALIATRVSAAALSAFGLHAFADRSIAARLTATVSFDYWDPSFPVAWFLLEYVALIAAGAIVAHYGRAAVRRAEGWAGRIADETTT
ncbi:DUF4405 domain-containing protein [Siculibacillus lacustris]|uniref:DUF4405 domain-containing protein n=1 Tax=Siculibacillus lacustris TaxID=1549641 RepID=A0A4Q9VF39_9HYPH|nr:DUF4405 domain-containing protein [Siculibacillus lacustris]TBW33293.1 DUF4405 domain-containing protein [Siculibacillus lacustris]